MFPNGYNFNMPFYQPYGNIGMGIAPRTGFVSGLRNGIGATARTGGLFSRLAGLKGINWQGLLNNTSRTLGVINQAIPIVKQVGPMYNNMKSMLKVASLFKDETDPSPRKSDNSKTNTTTNLKKTNTSINENNYDKKENTIITNNYSNSPNFFI